MPKQFDIAICSLGVIGLITSKEPVEVTYPDGNKGTAWTGIVLEDITIDAIGGDAGKKIHVKAGDLWSSRNPMVACSVQPSDIIRASVLSGGLE